MTFAQAQALSVAEEKFLLVYVAASWCEHSARMDEETWPDISVTSWVRKEAVALRWDLDGDSWMPVEFRGIPTTVVYSGEIEVGRHEGFLAPSDFLEWLESMEPAKNREME